MKIRRTGSSRNSPPNSNTNTLHSPAMPRPAQPGEPIGLSIHRFERWPVEDQERLPVDPDGLQPVRSPGRISQRRQFLAFFQLSAADDDVVDPVVPGPLLQFVD